MKHSIQTAKRILLTSVAALFISTASLPALTWADDTPSPSPSPAPTSNTDDNSATATPPASTTATPYTYNASTGLWENDIYTWDPTTGQTTPKTPTDYSYNPATGHWDTTGWVYDPASKTYVPNTPPPTPTPAATPAADPTGTNDTPAATPAAGSTASPALLAPSLNTPASTPGSSLGMAQPGSIFDSFYNASISNTISSNANSGNALVVNNNTGGSASSGNATAIANVINMLQSATSLDGGNLSTFTANINGDVNGNLLIDPAQIGAVQSASTTDTNVAINNTANAAMDNAISVNAGTGDATVSSNTNAGNATTGNANAVADVVNLINSIIAAKQSFLGVINIYGNLNGDITVPQGLVDSLLANNGTAPGSNNDAAQAVNANTNVSSTDTQTITNAVNSAATTGEATVSDNTNAGNATTGNAATNVTILNLTGRDVVAANSLLVFVNVLGHWVGLIMNAPAGTTAAAFGGGVTQNTINAQTDVTSKTNDQITNNIGLTAASGDASVTGNTHAGNATTGNATTSANLANITGSQFGLSNWFGILFINVFGNWLGNFGVQPTQTAANTGNPASAVFQFVPTSGGGSAPAYTLNKLWQSDGGLPTSSSTVTPLQHTVLTASKSSARASHDTKTKVTQPSYSKANAVVAGSIVSVGVILFAIDGYRTYRRRHQTASV